MVYLKIYIGSDIETQKYKDLLDLIIEKRKDVNNRSMAFRMIMKEEALRLNGHEKLKWEPEYLEHLRNKKDLTAIEEKRLDEVLGYEPLD